MWACGIWNAIISDLDYERPKVNDVGPPLHYHSMNIIVATPKIAIYI